jgi:hypothetical protein
MSSSRFVESALPQVSELTMTAGERRRPWVARALSDLPQRSLPHLEGKMAAKLNKCASASANLLAAAPYER